MKKIIRNSLYWLLLSIMAATSLKAATSAYFYGPHTSFNPEIPSPESFLGYETGTHHTRYDQLVSYFRELDRVSEKAQLLTLGYTHEGRPLLSLVVSSEKNLARLEEIRLNHLKVTNPFSDIDHGSLPVISVLGFGVHGNESSAPEAAILTAYYLLASEDPEMTAYLSEGIYFIEPSRNPDGHDRHAHWVNSQKSKNLVADPADLEHNEAYPGGRGNHYWFDLNRDWIPAIHPESRARLDFYHSWLPHLTTCHHEMGTNNTFFFEPTKSVDRESPLVPQSHYALNHKFARYISGALNKVGSLYYTREDFDNFNPTFGSSYPDYNGTLAILFEQGSSRGFIQERTAGFITFESAVRNQLLASIASIRASHELKADLVANQKAFFMSAYENGAKGKVKGYVFGDKFDYNRNLLLAGLLKRHRIDVYENDRLIVAGEQQFLPGRSFLVPLEQAQNRMVELFFNKDISVPDSVFYDGSTWTTVLSFGLPYAPLTDTNHFNRNNTAVNVEAVAPSFSISSYAYLVPWNDYNSAAFLSSLHKKNIHTLTSFRQFTRDTGGNTREFGQGTLVIPVEGQKPDDIQLHQILTELSKKFRLPVFPAATSLNVSGIDLGSSQVKPLQKPEILILTGRGISSLETGDAWYLIDQFLDISVTRAEITNLDRLNLKRYNTIILPGIDSRAASPVPDKAAVARLKNWVAEGGTLIALNSASEWVINHEIVKEKLVTARQDSTGRTRTDFENQVNAEGSKVVGGTILQTDVDITHPLGFGFTQRKLPVLKNNMLALQFSSSPYQTAGAFEEEPLISGYISDANLRLLSGTASVLASPVQRGRVILFAFNPVHRASWHSTARLFYNAIFFGQLIGGAPVRYRAADAE